MFCFVYFRWVLCAVSGGSLSVSLPQGMMMDGISFSRACILKNIMIVAHFQTTSACVGVPEIRIKYLGFVWLPSIVLLCLPRLLRIFCIFCFR